MCRGPHRDGPCAHQERDDVKKVGKMPATKTRMVETNSIVWFLVSSFILKDCLALSTKNLSIMGV